MYRLESRCVGLDEASAVRYRSTTSARAMTKGSSAVPLERTAFLPRWLCNGVSCPLLRIQGRQMAHSQAQHDLSATRVTLVRSPVSHRFRGLIRVIDCLCRLVAPLPRLPRFDYRRRVFRGHQRRPGRRSGLLMGRYGLFTRSGQHSRRVDSSERHFWAKELSRRRRRPLWHCFPELRSRADSDTARCTAWSARRRRQPVHRCTLCHPRRRCPGQEARAVLGCARSFDRPLRYDWSAVFTQLVIVTASCAADPLGLCAGLPLAGPLDRSWEPRYRMVTGALSSGLVCALLRSRGRLDSVQTCP